MADQPRSVVIIGGGLAGMVTAKTLAENGVRVTLLEASYRLGGKAGADQRELDLGGGQKEEVWIDHGYHIFPGWYRNVRQLLDELGLRQRLLDTDELFVIAKPPREGQPARFYSHASFNSLRAIYRNLFKAILPWHLSAMSYYSLLDLAAESFSMRGYLDRVSVSGFFRSRYYRHEAIANFHHQTVLQASAIPFYEMSAMTMQKLVRAFMRTPSPMLSMLDSDLQTAFIEPFRRHLEKLGVKILLDCPAQSFEVSGAGLAALNFQPGAAQADHDEVDAADAYVLAVPHDSIPPMIGPFVFDREAKMVTSEVDPLPLSGVWHLRSAPMAALQVYFDQRLPNVPKWHTNLHGSKYGLSFIDISQHWKELRDKPRTVLAVIASNFQPLASLPENQQVRHVLTELLEYVGLDAHGKSVVHIDQAEGFRTDGGFDIECDDDAPLAGFKILGAPVRIHSQPNLQAQLFLNTSGAWQHRPSTRTALDNLFITGDFCRSEADLTTMESAVMSALNTSRDVLSYLKLPAAGVGPLALDLPPRWQLLLLKYGLGLAVLPIGLVYAVQRQWNERKERQAEKKLEPKV